MKSFDVKKTLEEALFRINWQIGSKDLSIICYNVTAAIKHFFDEDLSDNYEYADDS